MPGIGVSSIKAVFFDFFGTLLVYGDMAAAWEAWLTALHGELSSRGLAMSRNLLADQCHGFFGLPEPADNGDGLTIFERRIHRLASELNLGLCASDIHSTATTCVESWQQYVTLDPQATDVLNQLRDTYHLALVSNFDHSPHARAMLDRYNLTPFFEAVVISAEVGFKKPDPRIFQPALSTLKLSPEEVVYVGDSDEDVEAARAAGIYPVKLTADRTKLGAVILDYGESGGPDIDNNCEDEKPSHQAGMVIGSIAELPEVVDALANRS
jgi:HAD superfamily hydrolase (TIGR01549 family)